MIKTILFFLVILSSTIITGQISLQLELDVGTSFQSETILSNLKTDNTFTTTVRFGSNVLIPLNQQYYIEFGVFGRYNRGNHKVETLSLTSNSLKMQIPLFLGYMINDNWGLSFGVSAENTRDFNALGIHKEM